MKITKTYINKEGKEETKDFESYWEMVDYFAKNKINCSFANSVIEHSKGLTQRFARNFDGELMLYTIDFKKEVFDEDVIIGDFKNFLQRNGDNKISVIVQKDELLIKDRKFYQEMNKFIGNKITFKKFEKGRGGRFMVIENAYREALNKNDDQNFIAEVNFNDEEKRSGYLRECFKWAQSNYSSTCSFI